MQHLYGTLFYKTKTSFKEVMRLTKVYQSTKTTVFSYSKANEEEARSVVRALPLFIRDYFKLDPSFFCSTDAIAEAMLYWCVAWTFDGITPWEQIAQTFLL